MILFTVLLLLGSPDPMDIHAGDFLDAQNSIWRIGM
jgi:hypothetical protein